MSIIEKATEKLEAEGARALTTEHAQQNRPAQELDVSASPQWRQSASVELDLARLKKAGFITPDRLYNPIAEQFRYIKRPILKNMMDAGHRPLDRPNLIMVTSALPGEGKTYTSINLALSIAMELDRRALLVDGDIFTGGTTKQLGITAESGLSDLLAGGNFDFSDLLLRTNVEHFSVLPAGNVYPNATELLASGRMRNATTELADRYADRVVVLDAPPLLATGGAVALSHSIGQILIVVEANKTPRAAVEEALDLLDDSVIAGVTLNKVAEAGPAAYRGYGYRGHYGGYPKSQEPAD